MDLLNFKRLKVLHVSAHLGGGVGKAISSLILSEEKKSNVFSHRIVLLEKPIDSSYLEKCREAGIEVEIIDNAFPIYDVLRGADIVIIHWWQHPRMADFLVNKLTVPVRLIIWFHVNGCSYPYIPPKLACIPHRSFFTTPYSLENPAWCTKEITEVKKRSRVVYGLGNLGFYLGGARKKSKKFIVGYVGTLTMNKLHPDFLDFCEAAIKLIPNIQFRMVGEINDEVKKTIIAANQKGFGENIEWVGYSNNIPAELSNFDVFGYLLNKDHFGSTENAVLEAMSSGIPVVMLNQPVEKHILNEKSNIGILVNGPQEYAESLLCLYKNPIKAKKIGDAGRCYVNHEFGFEKNILIFREELHKLQQKKKKLFKFDALFGVSPDQWLLACSGEYKSILLGVLNRQLLEDEKINFIKALPKILVGKNKSSINHFHEVFPGNSNIREWSILIDG